MDRYDKMIERLVDADVSVVQDSWLNIEPLFSYVEDSDAHELRCGCLSMIRGDATRVAAFRGESEKQLTAAILSDAGLPASGTERCSFIPEWNSLSRDMRLAILNRFANWQRALDATIRQGKPWHPDFTPPKESEKQPLTICATESTIQPALV